MTAPLRLLIIGGYGTFGGRAAKLLAGADGLHLVIAGRSEAKARAFCATLSSSGADPTPLGFDRDGDLHGQLRATAPDCVLDATGPFQAYGDEPYRVVRACIELGIDYLDLADGSQFVEGIGRFDDEARSKGVCVLSGVSSFPVLTAAVGRRLASGLDEVETISAGVAPSPYAGVGLNVIRAIAGYAGQPVRSRRAGGQATAYPLTDTRRYTIAPPGELPLRPTLFSLVDVPDLRLLPRLWPQAREVWIGAGPVPEPLHLGLIALAWLVRLRLLRSLSPLAPLLHWASNRLVWGEDRGGMFVQVRGQRGGSPVERTWHMTAEGANGPLIPSMAVEALVRKRLAGERPRPGARPALRELELKDYERLFARRAIRHGERETPSPEAPLYQRVLGAAWERLPAPLRAMHEPGSGLRAGGLAEIKRGRNPLARLVALVIGFPREGQDVRVSVVFTVRDGVETWRRAFGSGSNARVFSSRQRRGRGSWDGLLCEQFGPVTVGMALVVEARRLTLVVRRWTLLGAPMPRFLAPRGDAFESVDEHGRFRFSVEIGHPLTGLIVSYRGWLEPQAAAG